MAGQGSLPSNKLREFLRELKPGARALLIAELERGLLRGDSPRRRRARPGRTAAQRSATASPRRSAIGDPARLFFQPLEPFLVDDGPDHKHRGRIARSRARADLAVDRQHADAGRGARPIPSRSSRRCSPATPTRPNSSRAASRIAPRHRMQQMLDASPTTTRNAAASRVQLGTPRALEDVQALAGILKARDALAMLGTQLPGHIKIAGRPAARERQGAARLAARRRSPICSSIRWCW